MTDAHGRMETLQGSILPDVRGLTPDSGWTTVVLYGRNADGAQVGQRYSIETARLETGRLDLGGILEEMADALAARGVL